MTPDIENRIRKCFSDIDRVERILTNLAVPEEEWDRVVRSALYLSDSDYDSLEYWVRMANEDRRDVYYFAEYDNRSERKWNFSVEFDKQYEYEYRNK